jgi:hypothetical protein
MIPINSTAHATGASNANACQIIAWTSSCFYIPHEAGWLFCLPASWELSAGALCGLSDAESVSRVDSAATTAAALAPACAEETSLQASS